MSLDGDEARNVEGSIHWISNWVVLITWLSLQLHLPPSKSVLIVEKFLYSDGNYTKKA